MAKTKDLDREGDEEDVAYAGYSYTDQMESGGYWEEAAKESEALNDSGGGDPDEATVKAAEERRQKALEAGPDEPENQPRELT